MWLEVLSGEDAGRVVEVPPGQPFVLGRVQGADLVVRDARASRLHVELTPDGDAIRLHDLDSANGTLVDGERVDEALLRGGERIQIGDVRIAVLAQEPAATGAPIAERVRAGATTEGPSWSMIGRLVERRTRGGRRLTYAALAAAVLAVGAVAVLVLRGGSDEERAAEVVRSVGPATVQVDAGDSGSGSGWVLDAAEGLIVTAAHVVNLGTTFAVDGARAEVVAVAPCEDLALLRARGTADDPSLELARAGGWEQGESVLAFGFPDAAVAGEPPSSTRGVISAARTGFRDPAADVPRYAAAIRTDTALDPGFSGGPLVDLDGRVVGVNAAARTAGADGRPLQGANYAIAADRAGPVLDELRSGRSLAWIGASFGYPSVEDLIEGNLPPGLWIQGAVPRSGAADAGLGRGGELLVAVDGRPVDATLSGWCRATRGIRSGARAQLELVDRDGRRRTVPVRFD